ncbi:MAG: long-chain fatty acid--CoA ligase [Actinomycetaceae bacterium]|nr:long-chain fatty acid--CoA ligase [Arcanobacterium sp.]MDD7504802.1 long-chain fatty acid--CoA ligase [Actinomycetaceae bacterium]MDY6142669.1 long-chain fatty acid--CoA ligase [Arcanobacterium sp.]
MVLPHQQIDFDSLGKQQRAALENPWRNVGSALDTRAQSQPDRIGWMYPDANDEWKSLTWKEFRDTMHIVASGFLSYGIEPGSVVAICANTSIRWVLSDFAVNSIAAVTCAIYPNTHISEVEFIVSDSGSTSLVVENTTLLERMIASPEVNDALAHIVLLNGDPGEKYGSDQRIVTWEQILEAGKAFHGEHPERVRELIDSTNSDSLASIIYTSGTTGRPKGVELTHGNWIYEGTAWGSNYTLQEDDLHFIWLPLTHVFGKSMLLVNIFCGTTTALDGRVPKIVENLGIIKPTLMCGVPRIFEKVRAGTQAIAKPGTPKAGIISWAMKVGEKSFPYRSSGKPMPRALNAQYKLADKLVFSTIRKTLGGNIRQLVSGSARLDPDLQRWFFNLGIKLVEGYGVTETAAVTTYNRPWEFKMGTVGKVAPGTQMKIANDGEILIRGGGVMRAYHNDPELTEEMTRGGWFHTGDVGSIDDEGYVRITDRIKDVMKSSNGKFISPAAVEGVLTSSSPAIAQAVAIGEGRKYVSALIALDEEWVEKWASLNGLKLSYAKALKSPELRETIQSEIDTANQNLSRWEQVKKFEFLPGEMTADEGTATPTAKVKRRVVMDRYADLVEKMYEGAELWGPANPNYV